MLDKMMSNEEQEDFVRKIWESQKAEIEKSVAYSLRAEMSTRTQSIAQRIIAAKLKDILNPLIDAKKVEIQTAAEKMIERLSNKLEESVKNELKEAFTSYHYDFANEITGQLKTKLNRALQNVLSFSYESKEFEEK